MSARSVIHCIARCTECEWEHQDYRLARHEAAKHARKTGHKVTGEQAMRFEYDGVSHRRLCMLQTKNPTARVGLFAGCRVIR